MKAMRTDSLDVSSLVSYINDIKPFHSKLTDVVIEYQANDNVFVKLTDASSIAMHFSSVWELERVSDGKRKQYRIPAAVFPRHSDDFHQCTRQGVSDEVPRVPGAYPVPHNNGVEVSVNGGIKQIDIDYTINETRTVVQFIRNVPVLGDVVCLNWTVVDRVFIGINGEWQGYDLEYNSVGDGLEMFPYDAGKFDSDNSLAPVVTQKQLNVKIKPFGRVRAVADSKGQSFYIFEFDEAVPLNTKIWIRVEQREAYNGWTQTSIKDTVKVQDLFRFYDTVNAWVVDPGTWNQDPINPYFDLAGFDEAAFDGGMAAHLFGIDISSNRIGLYDNESFDIMDYDSLTADRQIGYYRLFNIKENLNDRINPKIIDTYKDQIKLFKKNQIKPLIGDTLKLAITSAEFDRANAKIVDNDPNAYDFVDFDNGPFDSIQQALMTVKKSTGSTEQSATRIRESLTFAYGDGSGSFAIYSPDDNGVIQVTTAVSQVQITHNFGYVPAIAVYTEGGQQFYPNSVSYPSSSQIFIKFTTPLKVTIRLA
jgi:hypothetical protein